MNAIRVACYSGGALLGVLARVLFGGVSWQSEQAAGPPVIAARADRETARSQRVRAAPAPHSAAVGTDDVTAGHAHQIGAGATSSADYRPDSDDAYNRSLYSVYREFGAEEMYHRRFDAIPTRPLGIGPRAFHEWSAGRSIDELPHEPWFDATIRLSGVNRRTPTKLDNGVFQVIAFRVNGELEVATGLQGDGPGGDPWMTYLSFDPKHRFRSFDKATPAEREFVLKYTIERLRVMGSLFDMLHAPEVTALGEIDDRVVAFLARTTSVVVVRQGDDPELDRRLDALGELHRGLPGLLQQAGR